MKGYKTIKIRNEDIGYLLKLLKNGETVAKQKIMRNDSFKEVWEATLEANKRLWRAVDESELEDLQEDRGRRSP